MVKRHGLQSVDREFVPWALTMIAALVALQFMSGISPELAMGFVVLLLFVMVMRHPEFMTELGSLVSGG